MKWETEVVSGRNAIHKCNYGSISSDDDGLILVVLGRTFRPNSDDINRVKKIYEHILRKLLNEAADELGFELVPKREPENPYENPYINNYNSTFFENIFGNIFSGKPKQ